MFKSLKRIVPEETDSAEGKNTDDKIRKSNRLQWNNVVYKHICYVCTFLRYS